MIHTFMDTYQNHMLLAQEKMNLIAPKSLIASVIQRTICLIFKECINPNGEVDKVKACSKLVYKADID